jgi:hypothetical protein
MTGELPDPGAAGEAAELRRALVRFLVESSFEGTQQAKVAEELLKAVRAIPAQSADAVTALSRRVERLEGAVANLSGQLEQLGDATAKQVRADLAIAVKDIRKTLSAVGSLPAEAPRGVSPPVRVLTGRSALGLTGILGSAITGISAALLTALLLAGGSGGGTKPPASGTPPAASAASTASAMSSPEATSASASAPPPVASAVPGEPAVPSAASAWQEIWERVLQEPVVACPGGPAATVRRCLCAADEACTLAHAQGVSGGSVVVLQALLHVHAPPLSMGRIDGKLGNSTMGGLVKLTQGCTKVAKVALQVQQEWKAKGAVDAHEIDPILAGLASEPRCLSEHP